MVVGRGLKMAGRDRPDVFCPDRSRREAHASSADVSKQKWLKLLMLEQTKLEEHLKRKFTEVCKN